MNNYIQKLLNEHKRVIIPDFGAFIVKQGSPKTFVFNEFLKYNDGLLIDYIVSQEKVSKEEAETKVKSYVEEINATLNKNESFAIEGIGSLSKDNSGKVVFSMSGEAKAETKKEETPAATADKAKSTSAKTEEKKTVKPEDSKQETKEPEKKVEKQETIKEPVKAQEAKKTVTTEEPKQEKKTELKEFTYHSGATASKSDSEKKQQSGNALKYFLWTTFAVIIAGGIVYFAIIKKESKKQTAIIEDTATVVDTTPMSEAAEEDTLDKVLPKGKNIYMPETDNSKYYVIAGCFRIESNADNYTTKLRKQGFNAQKFGTYNNMYAVCFDSFEQRRDALNMLRNIRKQVEPNAWMLYYPQ